MVTGIDSRKRHGAAPADQAVGGASPRVSPDTRPDRKLLLAIHDVSPRFETQVDRLRNWLGGRVSEDKIALLVIPNHWGDAPIRAGTPFAGRLRGWAERGSEIFVHGWHHWDASVHRSASARLKARFLTAGEAEFLGMDRASARARMHDGKALLEDITGRGVIGFVAPAWLYGQPALEALADCGFGLAEDHWKIWQPETGTVLCRSPVLTWASRSRARVAASLAAAEMLPLLTRGSQVARIAVHPGDTTVPALMASIDRAVVRFRDRRVARYRDLLPTGSLACAS